MPFEAFARDYVAEFAYKTLTSDDFYTFFMGWCKQRDIDASKVPPHLPLPPPPPFAASPSASHAPSRLSVTSRALRLP